MPKAQSDTLRPKTKSENSGRRYAKRLNKTERPKKEVRDWKSNQSMFYSKDDHCTVIM
jgi:hypothetical protein